MPNQFEHFSDSNEPCSFLFSDINTGLILNNIKNDLFYMQSGRRKKQRKITRIADISVTGAGFRASNSDWMTCRFTHSKNTQQQSLIKSEITHLLTVGLEAPCSRAAEAERSLPGNA